MRKTQSITLTLMAGLAAACSDGRAREEVGSSGDFGAADEPRSCVDDQNRVVADSLCTRPRAAGGGFYPFFFYYGGRALMSGGGQAVMTGGTRTTLNAPAPRSVSRGGIGARAAGRGGSFGG